jgi:hypothetical protein
MDDWALRIIASDPILFTQFIVIGRALYPEKINLLTEQLIKRAKEETAEQQPPQIDEREIPWRSVEDWMEHRRFYRQAIRQACALLRESAGGN